MLVGIKQRKVSACYFNRKAQGRSHFFRERLRQIVSQRLRQRRVVLAQTPLSPGSPRSRVRLAPGCRSLNMCISAAIGVALYIHADSNEQVTGSQ